jgi:hypothetical protein
LLRRCVWPGEVRCLNGSIAAGPTWTNVSGARRRIRCPGRAARLIAIDGGAEAIGSTDDDRWLVLLSGACAAPFHFLLRSIAAWLADGGGAAVGGVMCCRHHARRTALRDGLWAPLEGASTRVATREHCVRGSRGRQPPGGGAGGGAPCPGVQGGGAPCRGVQGGGAPLHLRRLIALPLDELTLPIADACDAIPPWKFYA